MIKIYLDNAKEIEHKHLTALKIFVETKIDYYQKNSKDTNLIKLLDYLKSNVTTLLCGKKSELEGVIKIIETNYYISKLKLSKILSNRKRKVDRKNLYGYLSNYAIEKDLVRHLPSTAYAQVNIFEEEVKKLSTNKWNGYDDILEEIFDYKGFTQKSKGWSAYELVSDINVSVCPYCNRSFISLLDQNNKRTRPVLDHFYAKGLYPYLSLSLYNLVPSCYVCNSSFKGDIDFYKDEAIYPYEEEFLNLAHFKTDFSDKQPYDYRYLLGISKEFKIIIEISTPDSKLVSKVQKSINTFALEDLYNTHQDIVSDLIRNAIVNNSSRIDEIYHQFGDIFKSREEVMQSLYLNYLDNQNTGKRPLSKLTQDICKEIGLLKI